MMSQSEFRVTPLSYWMFSYIVLEIRPNCSKAACSKNLQASRTNILHNLSQCVRLYVKIIVPSDLIRTIWQVKSNCLALGCQLYISAARPDPRALASSVVGSTVSLQNRPVAPGEASVLLRLLFSIPTRIHPAWSTCQTLHLPPSSPLLSPSSSAPLGLWRWASPQWRYSTDCNTSSWNGGFSLVNIHAKSGSAASWPFLFLLLHFFIWLFFFYHYMIYSMSFSNQLSLTMSRGGAGCAVCHLRARLTKRKHSLRF